jgi:hypothetical protein
MKTRVGIFPNPNSETKQTRNKNTTHAKQKTNEILL